MSRLTYNVSNSNPLIPRQQTYVLDRKLVSIHSEDRDIKKYPQSNKFSIQLPVPLENVQSVRMVDHSQLHIMYSAGNIRPPDEFLYNFTDITSAYHNNIAAVSKKGRIMTIEIQEVFYCQKT